MKAPTRYLAHMSWQEIEALEKNEGVVILPIGAVEQHGPHLPTETDSLIITHMVDAMLLQLPDHVRAWALPPLNYGKSNEHINFPGTMTLSANTLSAVLHDIGASVRRAGFRRLAFMNGHGGNVAVLEAAARDIRIASGLICFCMQPGLYMEAPFDITPEEARYGFHAGDLETSLILAIDPGSWSIWHALSNILRTSRKRKNHSSISDVHPPHGPRTTGARRASLAMPRSRPRSGAAP